eukprot:CAMPEP_0116574432 /NCGR_PEP_ID=MMETSP0397-20121206/19387_1 /TAXON_ID=216820 /ORGANISM="Cyclophora tenuis, Strain ECT3854" /LENGTH=35 /DNA_ID= /DNA_START= /DNA_END= /DNA_ORIENTATION=
MAGALLGWSSGTEGCGTDGIEDGGVATGEGEGVRG